MIYTLLGNFIAIYLNQELTKITVTQQPENVSTIKTIEENRLAVEDVTLQTPNYEMTAPDRPQAIWSFDSDISTDARSR